jgi:hypothetical protein
MGMLLYCLERLKTVTREHEAYEPLANLPTEFPRDELLQIGFVIDDENGGSHAARPNLAAMSVRS